MTIHWCGTGLSAIPGLRRLIEAGHEATVWNRTVDKARVAVGDLTDDIREFTPEAVDGALQAGDVVVSMLPADQHVPLARICIAKYAHFVSSSYVSPEMRALDEEARAAGSALINEVGLDPGIDHLMAHDLVAQYLASPAYGRDNVISFTSYCGGVPKNANAFRYKFSWSPVGVLKALLSPSRSIRDYSDLHIAHPWDAVRPYAAPLSPPETFEVYPNRDSLPFMEDYRFDPSWKVKEFVRGTIRLNGWADAWAPIFDEIQTLEGPDGEERLQELADQLWRDNAYAEGEPDRVVLLVSFKAEKEGAPVWHKTWTLDAWGDVRGSAMARLVSIPVALTVEAILARELPVGVHPAPHDPKLVRRWLDEIGHLAQHMRLVDHLK